jgi:hypothetical protein
MAWRLDPRQVYFLHQSVFAFHRCIFGAVSYVVYPIPCLLLKDTAILPIDQLHRPLTEDDCHTLYLVTGWMFIFGIGLTELVLVIRTWALYDKSPKLGGVLVVYFCAFWVAICYTLSKFLASLRCEDTHLF